MLFDLAGALPIAIPVGVVVAALIVFFVGRRRHGESEL